MSRTVADALADFFRVHSLDREGYRADRLVVHLGPITLPFPNPGLLPLHDLHHVALAAAGYTSAPNFWGEVEVSALELRSGPPTALITLLCVGALALGALLSPRRVLRSWRRYRGCTNLYRERDVSALLALPVEELLERMRLRGKEGARERERPRRATYRAALARGRRSRCPRRAA